MYLLDTDTCSYILRERPIEVLERFNRLSRADIAISVITEAELWYGACRSGVSAKIQPIVQDFLSRIIVLPWDRAAAAEYGVLRAALEAQGTPIGNMDTMIAAHALSLRCCLVSHNLRHFGKVPNLRVESWVPVA